MKTAVFYCVNHIVMVFTEKVNSKTGLSVNFVKTITWRLQNVKKPPVKPLSLTGGILL